MEQMNNVFVKGLRHMFQHGASQGLSRPEQEESNKKVQGIDLNTEFDKKIDESLKNSKNLDRRDIKIGVVPYENSEDSNKIEVKSDGSKIEDQKKLEDENIRLKERNNNLEKRVASLENQIRQKDEITSKLVNENVLLKWRLMDCEWCINKLKEEGLKKGK